MNPSWARRGGRGGTVGAVVVPIVLVGSGLVRADATQEEASEPERPASSEAMTYDCGTLALYHLLRLEGRPTELTALEAVLPPPRPGGYSMTELRDAAQVCGLTLTGVRMHPSDKAPDRPLLAFVMRDGHGHFLVVRPVGHSGKRVQVLDGTRAPEVLGAVDLYDAPGWTGLALIPPRPNWPLRIVGGMLAAGVAVAVPVWRAPRVRRRR